MKVENVERTPYSGRFLPSRKGGWIGTPTCDMAPYLGKTESNLLISLAVARIGKPGEDLLYCDAPDDLPGARKFRKAESARKTKLVSHRYIKWFSSVTRGDSTAWEAIAVAYPFKRRQADQPDEVLPADELHEEVASARSAPQVTAEEEHSGPPPPPVVFNRDGQALTTSLAVAAAYGKRHDHVLRDIEAILAQPPKLGAQFVFRKASYVGENGHTKPMYEMNEQAFCLLALPFTGPEGFRLRVAYIEEFKRMQQSLADRSAPQDMSDDAVVARAFLITQKSLAAANKEIALLKPKAASNDRLAKSYGLLNITETAKMLQTARKFFVQFLLETKRSYRSGRTDEADSDLIGYGTQCESGTGLLTHKPFTYQNRHGEMVTKSQMLITPKGLAVFGHEYRLWYVKTYPFNPPPPPIQPDMLNPRPN